MTPGLQHLVAFKAAFDFPNEVLSFAAACACGLFRTLVLGARETPVAYQVATATAGCTQACFHAAGTRAGPHPQGGCWESGVEGSGAEGAPSGGLADGPGCRRRRNTDVNGATNKQNVAATVGDAEVKDENREAGSEWEACEDRYTIYASSC